MEYIPLQKFADEHNILSKSTEETENWANLHFEPHNYRIYYVIIDLRHQCGISVPESQTFLLAKRSQGRGARRNGCFRRLVSRAIIAVSSVYQINAQCPIDPFYMDQLRKIRRPPLERALKLIKLPNLQWYYVLREQRYSSPNRLRKFRVGSRVKLLI